MTSKRILITGLSTYWGGRLAQALESDPEVEAIIGVDRRPPKVELQRTEFVRVEDQHSLISRIVRGAEIDTVVDTRLVVDSVVTTPRRAHENNVIGTMNVLAACGGADTPVRRLIFKSSAHYYGAEQSDPAFFTEGMPHPHPPRTPIERDLVEAEGAVRDFAEKNPSISVTVLRFCNGLGPAVRTSHASLFALAVIPAILGFDPRYQFIHEDDLAGCLEHAVRNDVEGVYNCGADGVLVLSEIADLLGKPLVPVLPPVGTGLATAALSRVGVRIPPEMRGLLRFGRAIDNRRFKATGYRYRYTTRETVMKLAEHQRLAPLQGQSGERYRYEAEVEEFLRWSPSVRHEPGAERRSPSNVPAGQRPVEDRMPAPAAQYGDLEAAEVMALLPSLERDDLVALREHEVAGTARPDVLDAIARVLARQDSPA